VSTLACDEPLSLSQLPIDRVVRIAGPSEEQLAVSLDPLPEGAPVVIRYRVAAAPLSALAVVEDILDRLEVVARELFPAWLPEAEAISTGSDFDRRVVRQLARRMASATEHFGPFLADVAEAALSGRAVVHRFEPELRARGLARIIGDAYGRTGVVLLVGPADGLAEDEQRRVAVACEWLTDHGDFGVWLTGDALPVVDRFSAYLVPVPAAIEAASPEDTERRPVIEYPALAGRPHPGSEIEQELARLLDRCEWAAGRIWNFNYERHSLAPRIRVDLVWQTERVVVEIDGPEHRDRANYAADRRRDNLLLLDGFAVLRFTNEDVAHDPQWVLATIEQLLTMKRNDEGKLS
jgi:very-short-patch-repair endonuclease